MRGKKSQGAMLVVLYKCAVISLDDTSVLLKRKESILSTIVLNYNVRAPEVPTFQVNKRFKVFPVLFIYCAIFFLMSAAAAQKPFFFFLFFFPTCRSLE